MNNLLIKNVKSNFTPGSPGVTARPGYPAMPAYTSVSLEEICGLEFALPSEVKSGGVFGMVYRCYPRYVYTYHEATPYIPPVVGVAPTPSSTLITYNFGWNAGARSIPSIVDDGYLKFKVGGSMIGGVVGFNTSDPDADYRGIKHAFYVSRGVAKVYESGVEKFHIGAYVSGQVFQIKRAGGAVTYLIDDVLKYTSAAPSIGLAFIDTSFYSGYDSIYDPELASTVTVSAPLPAFKAMASAGNYAQVDSVLPYLSTSARVAVSLAATLPAMKAKVYDHTYGEVGSVLPALTGSAAFGMLAPEYAIVESILPLFNSAVQGKTGNTGDVNAVLPAFLEKVYDHSYGEVNSRLPAMLGIAYAYDGPDEATMGSGAVTTGTMSATTEVMVVMNSTGTAVTVLAVDVLVDVSMMSAAEATSAYTLNTITNAVMRSLATATDGGPVWDQESAVWVVNLDTGASSSYENYPFNSFCKVGQSYFGATRDGVFLLEGDDDAGAEIRASANLGMSSLGTSLSKRLHDCYLGVSSTNTMYLRLTAEGQTYTYAARSFSEEMKLQRVDIGKGLKANYFTFEIYNNEGCDFELDTVEFRPANLTRRI